MIKNDSFPKVEDFFNQLLKKAEQFNDCIQWEKTIHRQEFINKLVDIISDERAFIHLVKRLYELEFSDKLEDKEKFTKVNLLLRGLTTSEIATITFLDIPSALLSYTDKEYTHHFLLWECGFMEWELDTIFKYIFHGFDVAIFIYAYNIALGREKNAKENLKGWVKEKAKYIQEATGIEIDIDKYVEALEEGLKEWANKMPSRAYEMYVKSLKGLIEAPFFDDIHNLNIYQTVEVERNLLGEMNIRMVLPNRPISILRYPFTFVEDVKVNKAIVYKLTDNSLPTFLLIQYDGKNGLKNFLKVYIEDEHSLGRLGLSFFIIPDPYYYENDAGFYDVFNDKELISKQLANEKLDAFIVDLVLGNALGDTISKGLLEEMKSSVHRDFRNYVNEQINNLDKGLAIAVGKQFEPLFKKMDKNFNPYKLNSLNEIINRFGDKGRWAIQKFRDLMATLVEDNNELIKDIEDRLQKGQENIPTIVAEELYTIIDNDNIYKRFIKESAKRLMAFSIRTGTFLHEVFSNMSNKSSNIDKGIDEIDKEDFIKIWEEVGFKNENIIKEIEKTPLLKELENTLNNAKKLGRDINVNIFKNPKGLTENYENFKKAITKDIPSDKAQLILQNIDQKYMITNNVESMRELVDDITGNLHDISGNEKQILYTKISEINEKAFCMKGEGKLKVGDKEVAPLRFNERYRGINMIPAVLTAIKMFTKNENDFKKLATLFTLGLFGVSPISLHILKGLGITKESKPSVKAEEGK